MKTLYLHVGTPKTGTTAIQFFCRQNEKLLEEAGLSYPRMPHYYGHLHESRNGLFLSYDWKDENGHAQREKCEKALSEGFQLVRNYFENFDNVLLSDEGIWFASSYRRRDIWQILLEEAEQAGYLIKMIVYLRRQDQYAVSCWNQQIKSGNARRCTWTLEEYLKNPPASLGLDYGAKITKLANLFGKENILVRRYDKSRFVNGSLLEDFLQVLGLPYTAEYEMPANANPNPGLSASTVEFKRVLNDMKDMSSEDNRYLKKKLKQYSQDFPGASNRSFLPAQEAQAFLRQFESGNRMIAREYFQEDSLLFDQSFPDTQKWQKNSDELTDDFIRVMGMLVVDQRASVKSLQDQMTAQQKQIKSLRKQIKKEQPSGLRSVWRHIRRRFG